MDQYQDLFTDVYITDWRHKVIDWETPVDQRVYCGCDSEPFISQLYTDGLTINQSCDECGKRWCLKCGDPERAPYSTPSVHSTAANPDGCKNNLVAKTQQRQAQVAGLRHGDGYQVCLVCNRITKNDIDPARVQCDGCATVFCFTCGLKHPRQDWVPGQACTWRGFGHHP
jgi:hypothetical protein